MTLSYTYDGSAFTYAIAPTSLDLTSGAEMGAPVFGGLTPEDPTAALTMKGHRPFVVEESACSQPRLFTGWTTGRGIGRSYEAGQFVGSAARAHEVTIVDLNALFRFRLISGADGNRPSETFAQRIAWILGSDYLTGLIEDTGYIASSEASYTIAAADYRDGYPEAVMSDLMDRTAGWYNYFAFWDPTAAAVGLWVGQLDDAVSTSTLRISNVAADVDNTTTFAPDAEAEVTVSPTETWSEVTVRYAHGTKRLFRSRASTATNYIRRGTTIDRPYTGSATTASAQAERFLDQHANEQDRITVTIIVPAAAAGLAVAGQRMSVKFSHLTGYTTFTSMRIVNTSLTPTNDHATHYALTLELAAPRPAGPGGTVSYFSHAASLPILCNVDNNNAAGGGIYWRQTTTDTVGDGWVQEADGYRIVIGAGPARTVTVAVAFSVSWGNPGGANGDCGFALDPDEDYPWNYTSHAFHQSANPLRLVTTDFGATWTATFNVAVGSETVDVMHYIVLWANAQGQATLTLTAVTVTDSQNDIEISLPTPPAVTSIVNQINNLEYLGDIPLGLPEL